MQDIGMSPGYRSGQHNLTTCSTCQRAMPDWMIDSCTYCGAIICMECSDNYGSGVACLKCAKLLEVGEGGPS